MINNKFCISFMFNNCYTNYEIKKKEKTTAGLWSLHSRTNLRPAQGNLRMPPLFFGRPTSHKNYLPETDPWHVGLDIRLEFYLFQGSIILMA